MLNLSQKSFFRPKNMAASCHKQALCDFKNVVAFAHDEPWWDLATKFRLRLATW